MAAKPDPGGKAILTSFLSQFGLASLGDWAWNTYIHAGGGDLGMQTVQAQLTDQAAFKARFPAYDKLAKAGKAMSPAEMLSYEQQARAIFHQAGLPSGFYDSPDDFAKFMVADVSPSELQARVQVAQTATLTAPTEVRSELSRLYNVKPGDLTAYFIDPQKALPILQNQYTSATIGAAAKMTGFGTLGVGQVEGLAALGVTDTQAREGFGKLGAESGLFADQRIGEDQVDTDTQIAATFQNNAAAQKRIAERQASRTSDFAGSSGTSVGNKGVSGLGKSDQSQT